MNKLILIVLLLSISYSSFSQTNYYGKIKSFRVSSTLSDKDYIPNTVIIKFKAVASSNARSKSVSPTLDLKSTTVKSLHVKFSEVSSTARITTSAESDRIGLNRIYELKYLGNAAIETVIDELSAKKNIEYAEPAYVYHTTYIPSDPLFSTRQSYLTQVKAQQAWDIIRDASGIIIGIVDTGSELTHEDLASNIISGIDLIGSSSTNFIEDNDANVKNAASDHGVHVSGLASAVSNNAKGIASIANAKLLIVKVAADDSPGDIYNGYEGIIYAADHGAKVINCSWGGDVRSRYGEDVVNYAISRDCLIIAAGGNQGNNVPDYPAGYKGVLAVANIMSNDVKASSSNYGGYIGISAPGINIYSTTYSSTYGVKSGTSMSAPIVSSAAALIKAYYPALSMAQVGELLRVTADNVDRVNTTYAGMLGKGRLNVYRALTESAPAIRTINLTFDDQHAGTYRAGNTIDVYMDLRNYLLPATGVQVTLESTNTNVTISNATQLITEMGTLDEKAGIGAFKVTVNSGTPDNTPVEFRIVYKANGGTYEDYETFTLVVARDYMNIITGNLSTSATSIGKIGFGSANETDGLGFIYKENKLLYESSLLIGRSANAISDNARATEGSTNVHFVKQSSINESLSDNKIVGYAQFNDTGNLNGLSVDVNHTVTADKQTGKDNYIVAEYEVVNRNATDLTGVYIGMFTDWDINGGASNATAYDATTKLGYVYSTNAELPYAGVKLLSTSAPPNYYPLSLSAGFIADDNFTAAEKFTTLSSGISSPGIGSSADGHDVSFVSGYGPYSIPANGSVKVAFAYIGADNLEGLKNSAVEAQAAYDVSIGGQQITTILSSYPNPITPNNNNNVAVVINLPEDAPITLEVFNMLGAKVNTLISGTSFSKGAHTLYYSMANLNPGIYILRLGYNGKASSHKISVLK
ncbi:S8 family peptidase [Arcticibacter eurypsychrophilus]|uniref:S8 family peptidase n=1 Tax=Arcticibacter eurypsychrophilus TaxID=1434752 RepID=UPI00084DE8C9|nr:S8 family peptidase [Arcticibacter eurypsychrophilus]